MSQEYIPKFRGINEANITELREIYKKFNIVYKNSIILELLQLLLQLSNRKKGKYGSPTHTRSIFIKTTW